MNKFYIYYIFLHHLMTPLAFGPKGHRQLAKLASLQECCRPIMQDITSWQHRILAEGNPQHISFAIDIEALCAESAALYPISISEAKPLRFSHDAPLKESRKVCAWAKAPATVAAGWLDPNGTLMSRSKCFLIFCENPEIQQVAAN